MYTYTSTEWLAVNSLPVRLAESVNVRQRVPSNKRSISLCRKRGMMYLKYRRMCAERKGFYFFSLA